MSKSLEAVITKYKKTAYIDPNDDDLPNDLPNSWEWAWEESQWILVNEHGVVQGSLRTKNGRWLHSTPGGLQSSGRGKATASEAAHALLGELGLN